MVKRKHLDRFFASLLRAREQKGSMVIVARSRLAPFSLQEVAEKFVSRGYVLHSSTRPLPVLLPQQAISRVEDIANFKGVYATDALSKCLVHGLLNHCRTSLVGRRLATPYNSVAELLKKGRSKKVFLHILRRCHFLKLPNGEFLSLKRVPVDFVIPVGLRETMVILGPEASRDAQHGHIRIREGQEDPISVALRVYLECAEAPSGAHGIAHALHAANIGYYLARRECPASLPDVMIGCFFHEIGRSAGCSDESHVFRSAEITKNLLKRTGGRFHSEEIWRAIRYQAEQRTSRNKIVACIWDADRLTAVGKSRELDSRLLSTKTAKKFARRVNAVLKSFGSWSGDEPS